MKVFMTIIALLAAFTGSWAADIHSTPSGGYWNNWRTWEGGTVPGEGDNVFLHGHVSVNGNLSCHNLTVYPGGRLYPGVSENSLTVGGSIVNNGTVNNYPGWYNLNLTCAGNITSSGQFIPYQLTISGTGNQSINASGNFKPANITQTSDLGTVTLLTDLNLENCQIDFNGGALDLSGGRQLALNGGKISNMAILGTGGGSLNLTGDVELWNTTADEINIQGICRIGDGVSIGTLHNHAVLQNYPHSNAVLYVTDRLNNYDTLRNYPGWRDLTLDLAGDLYNYGTMSNANINLSGDGIQALYHSDDAPDITCWNFTAQATDTPIQLTSNLRFNGCTVDLGGRTLRLITPTASHTLSVTSNELKNAVIQGNSASTLNFANECKLSNLTIDEARFTGDARCDDGVVVGIMHNHALLQNYQHSNAVLNVTDRLNNYGTLRNYPGWSDLTLDLAGDLYNYGTLSNANIILSGDGVQILYHSDDAPDITCWNFTTQATDTPIQLLSDVRFNGCTVDLGGRTLRLLTPTASHALSVTSKELKNAVIQGNSACTLNFANECKLSNLTIDEARFTGDARCDDGVVVGIMHNHALLQNNPLTYATLQVTDRLNNYGTLRNYPGWRDLTLDLAGDLYNYNILKNNATILSGDRTQIIWQSADATEITCAAFSATYSTHPLQARSDLRFSNCAIDFAGRTLDLCPGSVGREFQMVGQSLQNVVIMGGNGAALDLQENCNMTNVTADEIVMRGNALIHSGVIFGTLINHGTLRSHSSVNPAILAVTETMVNWGTLDNYPGWSSLHLYLRGDLHNHGTMSNQTTLVNGNTDQYLKTYPGCAVTSTEGFTLVSEIGPGQWYFNGHMQTNANSLQYNADPFADGVWQAYNGSAWSRYININEGLAAPVNLILTAGPNNALTLQWNQVSNATGYKVYYATVPEGPWTAFPGTVTDNNTEDGIVTYPLGQSQQRMFYKVTSLR